MKYELADLGNLFLMYGESQGSQPFLLLKHTFSFILSEFNYWVF